LHGFSKGELELKLRKVPQPITFACLYLSNSMAFLLSRVEEWENLTIIIAASIFGARLVVSSAARTGEESKITHS
jgi:hypothetical protein